MEIQEEIKREEREGGREERRMRGLEFTSVHL